MAWQMALIAGLQILPSLVDAVVKLTQKVEDESPNGGGEAKKAAVVGLVKAGMGVADDLADDGEMVDPKQKEAIIKLAGEATDVLVGLQNTVGTFKKS